MWENYEPSTVPSARYIAEIRSDPIEKASQYKPGTTFKSVNLYLVAKDGMRFQMDWAFTERAPVYKALLLILGGQEQPSGHVTVPMPMIGRRFWATIIERPAKNDKTKLVNEITRVSYYDETPPPEKTDATPKIVDDDGEVVPF
jgi:hypothetical protein